MNNEKVMYDAEKVNVVDVVNTHESECRESYRGVEREYVNV